MKEVRIPHTLRFVIFLLRLALGLNFFYFGVRVLFNPSFGGGPNLQPLINFSGSVSTSFGTSFPAQFWPWVSLVIGACLIAGFFTRIVAIIGLALTVMNYGIFSSVANLSPIQFANDATLVALCFLVLFFARAGEYFGLDRFIHFSFIKKEGK